MNKPARIPLQAFALRPKLWVALLTEAMGRSGRGFRKPSMKRRPPKGASHWRGERRPDKVERARLEAANPVFTGKINYRRSQCAPAS